MEEACGAVRNAAANADNKVAFASAGGIPALVAVLNRHIHSPTVMERAREAVRNVSANADFMARVS
jgi:hypothetical protein